MKECVIYKYVYHDEIIYIGKSDNSLNSRIEGHKIKKQLVELKGFEKE